MTRTAALILRSAGLLLLLSAALVSPWFVNRFAPTPPVMAITAAALLVARKQFLIRGIALMAFAEFVSPSAFSRLLGRLFDKPAATKALFSLLVILLPLTVAEVALRPFTIAHLGRKKTTLFARDPCLGWRMRPGMKARWAGVEVAVNSKGLRGPEIPYSRDSAKPRLVYLGDSVTFGYRLARFSDAYPFVVEGLIECELDTDVETVNASVGGYSPWQEALFLEQEGFRYQPDVVILGFVLNDVVEKLGLVRFGGAGIGYQLEQSYFSLDDRLRHNSALYSMIRRLKERRRFGADVREGAVAQELATVGDLARQPGLPRVREAWSLTFRSLENLFALCRDRGTPVAVVVFPFCFQLSDPTGLAAPQREITGFCESNGVPCLDLLPLLADRMRTEEEAPRALFLDTVHLSAKGNRVVARMIADWLRSEPLLWSTIKRPTAPAAADVERSFRRRATRHGVTSRAVPEDSGSVR
ncbi:SGNH/GDSL hydrolase family protein [Verrucomicrobiota bacterium]